MTIGPNGIRLRRPMIPSAKSRALSAGIANRIGLVTVR